MVKECEDEPDQSVMEEEERQGRATGAEGASVAGRRSS